MPNKKVYKYFLGRKVKSEKTITRGPNTEFGALYEAQEYLQSRQYIVGSLDGDNPIGFSNQMLGWSSMAKWRNLSKEDKDKLDGVLVSECFRTKDVKIIFFQD